MGGALPLLLLLSFAVSCSAAPQPILFDGSGPYPILLDASNCLELRCEWRGQGKECQQGKDTRKSDLRFPIPLLNDDETEGEFLYRLMHYATFNKFTIVNKFAKSEKCKQRVLWCRVDRVLLGDSGQREYFRLLEDPRVAPEERVKHRCKV